MLDGNSLPLLATPALVLIAAFFAVWVLLWLPIAVPLAIALKWHPPQPLTSGQKLPLLASLYLIAPLLLWGWVSIEHQSFATYGLPWNVSVLVSLGVGLVAGVLGLAMMFLIQQALGWIKWQLPTVHEDPAQPAPQIWLMLGSTLLIGVWVSATEELVFRGFLVTLLQQDYPPWVAAAIASLIFAALHLVWDGTDTIPQLPGLWLMGMVLVLARWADNGNLGLAWGLHAGWIWAIASLDTLHLPTYTGTGPVWMTGLGGKPLAGGMGILFLVVTAAVVWVSCQLQ